MKLVVTGSNGAIGRKLFDKIKLENKYEIIALGYNSTDKDIENIDLTDFPTTNEVIDKHNPDVIIHLAGSKDLKLCENKKEISEKLNIETSKNLAINCKSNNRKFIFISSDYVFDGYNGPFNETSKCAPRNQYGKGKLKVEEFLEANLTNYAIIRTSGVFGYDNDFVNVVKNSLSKGKKFAAFGNLYNNPTYVNDFISMLLIIVDKDLKGIFHCSGKETVSRYEFAKYIAEENSLNKELLLKDDLDFSNDLKVPKLELKNDNTYKLLNYFPKSLKEILKLIN